MKTVFHKFDIIFQPCLFKPRGLHGVLRFLTLISVKLYIFSELGRFTIV